MATFCRITGHARNLPRPCYFPLLPPISPADAKKLCRITGKATGPHNYSPIISFGKPIKFDGIVGCKITCHEDFSYLRPIFITTKDNEKSIGDLKELLKKMKHKGKSIVDMSKLYVYRLDEQKSNLVLNPELEAAIKTGEIDSLSLSKDQDHLSLKIRQGRTVKVKVEKIDNEKMKTQENLYYGEGQSRQVLEEQQQTINERNKHKQDTLAMKKLFEDKERKAEEEARKATERPKPKRPPVKFDPKKRQEKLEKMERQLREQAGNKAILLPKFDPVRRDPEMEQERYERLLDEQLQFEQMLEDLSNAHFSAVNISVYTSNFDWAETERAAQEGFDWDSFPHEEWIEPVDVEPTVVEPEQIVTSKDVHTLDIVASVETIKVAPSVPIEVLKKVEQISEEALNTTANVQETVTRMKIETSVGTFDEIGKIVHYNCTAKPGFMVERAGGSQFVPKEEYAVGSGGSVLSGAMISYDNKQRFVTGQIIMLAEQETFVAGQTVDTPRGRRFIPGQTVVKESKLTFVPGHSVETEEGQTFVAGHVLDTTDGPRFEPGVVINRGDGQEVFVTGQTVITEEGPKFVPGQYKEYSDGEKEFIPGINMPSTGGVKFIPGQVFQDEDKISFTPGQIVETVEGPSFVPGKVFQDPSGEKKFVKGHMVQNEDGNLVFEKRDFVIPSIIEELVIPNDELKPLAIAGRDVTGFIVNPANTANMQAGEELCGDIVETQDAVFFYLQGRLPIEVAADAKVICGKLVVDETRQRFIPGKILNTSDGEKFVPGQMVRTSHGEEFVPGQIVETSDGPKFVPGQLVSTRDGEKFVPGQVIIEEEGPRFVPGQIIQTKNGATFIPGQMMNTHEGQRFVPGQLVDTVDGPRFVPGQVIETSDGPKFIPGTVVETEDGLKYVPQDASESDEDIEIFFQGFEVSPEEMKLLSTNPADKRALSPSVFDQGLIDSATLKKLAMDTMVIHGRTPEPPSEKRKKRRKTRAKVAFDALSEEEEKEEPDPEDSGTDKLEIMKRLLHASSTMSSVKKERELRRIAQLLKLPESAAPLSEAEVISVILSMDSEKSEILRAFLGDDESLICEILGRAGGAVNASRNDEVRRLLKNAIQEVVTRRCDEEIDTLICRLEEDSNGLLTDTMAQVLLTEAVGIVCVTGNVEVASMLEKFISEPNNPNCLREDPDVLAVLRQLIVLHQVSDRDAAVATILQDLQNDPERLDDRNKVRKLIKHARMLLRKARDEDETPFDLRHIASSKDIPSEVFEQIKLDKTEAEKFLEGLPDELFQAIRGDYRYGGKLLRSLDSDMAEKYKKELEKFRKGMAIVVTKANMQAVIPKDLSRSICYGIIPYLLIDEEGFKFFERGLTGRKLAPSRIIENTWYKPDSYYEKAILYPQRVTSSGMQYNVVLIGYRHRPYLNLSSLQYTSLLPSTGPTYLSYADILSERRASREGSVNAYLMSSRENSWDATRRASVSSLRSSSPRRTSVVLQDSVYDTQNAYEPPAVPLPMSYTNIGYDFENGYESTADSEQYLPVNYSEPAPLAKSGTVARILDKYSNFSLAREFGYKNPNSAYCRYFGKSMVDYETEGRMHPRPSPPSQNLSGDYEEHRSCHLLRPFSDIYEADENESQVGELVRYPVRIPTPAEDAGEELLDNVRERSQDTEMAKTSLAREPYVGRKFNRSLSGYGEDEPEYESYSTYGSKLNTESNDEFGTSRWSNRSYRSPYEDNSSCQDDDSYLPQPRRKFKSRFLKREYDTDDESFRTHSARPYHKSLTSSLYSREPYRSPLEGPTRYDNSYTSGNTYDGALDMDKPVYVPSYDSQSTKPRLRYKGSYTDHLNGYCPSHYRQRTGLSSNPHGSGFGSTAYSKRLGSAPHSPYLEDSHYDDESDDDILPRNPRRMATSIAKKYLRE